VEFEAAKAKIQQSTELNKVANQLEYEKTKVIYDQQV